MNLGRFLSPEAIQLVPTASSKKRLLRSVAELGARAYHLCETDLFDVLLARENLGPTGVGDGVALPHARCENISEVSGVFLLLQQPVDYNSVDRISVDLVFGLFAPREAHAEHLRALASVSRALRNPKLRSQLRGCSESRQAFDLLTEKQVSFAA